MAGGAALAGGGLASCATGVLCLGGAAVAVGGLAIAADGAVVVGYAAVNGGANVGNLLSMASANGQGGGGHPDWQFDSGQIQSKYKHHEDFGVAGNWNKQNGAQMLGALKAHVQSATAQVIKGKYTRFPGQNVYHVYDPASGLNVMFDMDGNYISGWKLNEIQTQDLLTTGVLGGGD